MKNKNKVIGFVNQKGGVAKTTSAFNLAHGLADRGYKVLAIDFDAQGNLTTAFGVELPDDALTVGSWVLEENGATFQNVKVKINDNLDLIPSGISLAGAESKIFAGLTREKKLSKAINNVKKNYDYDYIIIDACPSLGVLTINVLAACNEIIVPLKPEGFSLVGALQLYDSINEVRESELNENLKINGFLLTMCDTRRKKSKEYIETIEDWAKKIGTRVYKTHIRNLTDISASPDEGKSIFDYKPNSKGCEDYGNFVTEFLEND